jgi:hypothetical protein
MIKWSQLGGDAARLGTNFIVTSMLGFDAAGSFATFTGPSLVVAECPSSPCSWGGGNGGSTPFSAGDLLIWTSNSESGANGPLIFELSPAVSGAGALIQEDAPGQFTAQIEVFNGQTLLGSFKEQSDTAGDPIYIGVIDSSGTNINKVILSIISTANPAGDVTDFALDSLLLRSEGRPLLQHHPRQGKFGAVKLGHVKAIKFHLRNRAHRLGPSITISGVVATDFPEFSILSSKTTCLVGTVLAPKRGCVIDVEFKPQGIGRRPPATLTIDDDAQNAPQIIPLTGKGK